MEDDSNNEDSDCEDDEEFMLNIQEKDAMYDELYEWASAGQKCTSNTWIADSGASCHMTNNDENMTDAGHKKILIWKKELLSTMKKTT